MPEIQLTYHKSGYRSLGLRQKHMTYILTWRGRPMSIQRSRTTYFQTWDTYKGSKSNRLLGGSPRLKSLPPSIPFLKGWTTTLSNAIKLSWRCRCKSIQNPCILYSIHVLLYLTIFQSNSYTAFYGTWCPYKIVNSFIVIMCPSIVLQVGSMMTFTSNAISFNVPPHLMKCPSVFLNAQYSILQSSSTSNAVSFCVPPHLMECPSEYLHAQCSVLQSSSPPNVVFFCVLPYLMECPLVFLYT